MNGLDLIHSLIHATGLPEETLTQELENLIRSSGKEVENITIDDIRMLLADYLQDVLLEAQEEFDPAK